MARPDSNKGMWRHTLLRIAAMTSLATGAIACRGAEAPPPPAAPPPPLATQQLPPKPPTEERATKVLALDSQNCGHSDAALLDFTRAEVLARCDVVGSTTRVLVTVLPRTTDPQDTLRALSLRFCGDVVSAEGPTGWKTEIERQRGRASGAADVTWVPPDTALDSASRRISGFAVTIRGPWRRGMGYGVMFSSGGVGGGSPHDCPYPF